MVMKARWPERPQWAPKLAYLPGNQRQLGAIIGHGLLCRLCAVGPPRDGLAGRARARGLPPKWLLQFPRQEKLFDFPLGTWSEAKRITVLTSQRQRGVGTGVVRRCSSSLPSSAFVFRASTAFMKDASALGSNQERRITSILGRRRGAWFRADCQAVWAWARHPCRRDVGRGAREPRRCQCSCKARSSSTHGRASRHWSPGPWRSRKQITKYAAGTSGGCMAPSESCDSGARWWRGSCRGRVVREGRSP